MRVYIHFHSQFTNINRISFFFVVVVVVVERIKEDKFVVFIHVISLL